PAAVLTLPAAFALDAVKVESATKANDATDLSLALHRLDESREDRFTLLGAILDLQQRIAASPSAQDLRDRLAPVLEDLYSRAQDSYIREFELAAIREQIVHMRLERAIEALHERAIGGGWSREQLAEVTASWMARADAFIDAPDPSAIRARVSAALDLAIQRSAGILESVREMRVELLRLQLEVAKQRMLSAVAQGQMSEPEFEEQLALHVARARAIYLSELQP
ncbi:MAG: hypothetical protein AAGG01_20905, partial [Planctomycetota bacterium]